MKRKLYDILKEVSEFNPAADRHLYLRQYDSGALRTILKYTFDPEIKFLLPKGPAPYKPTDALDQEGRLYSEIRRLYLFVEGGNPNLSNLRREALFIQLLESIDPLDAELLVYVKDKKLPFKGITEKIVRKAFPDLLSQLPQEEKDE